MGRIHLNFCKFNNSFDQHRIVQTTIGKITEILNTHLLEWIRVLGSIPDIQCTTVPVLVKPIAHFIVLLVTVVAIFL